MQISLASVNLMLAVFHLVLASEFLNSYQQYQFCKIVMAAVKQDGTALEYASKELRNNREIVMAAVFQNPGAQCSGQSPLSSDSNQ